MLLLCYPRLLGYAFNPLSVYFCYRADGALALLIYEVRNTFGDSHPYVLPVLSGEISDAGVRVSNVSDLSQSIATAAFSRTP